MDRETLSNPLDLAIQSRDRDTIAMVKEAVANDRVMLAYQPVVQTIDTQKPAFYEGLIRVLDPTGRVIPARDFIEAVESSELGRKLDCIALELGLQALMRHDDLRLSINMSAKSIGYAPWMRVLRSRMAQDETVAERLILEITESSAMIMPDVVTAFMNELQTLGICFALDDFGAGHTAFRYFREFYFDLVKIDGAFIRGIARDPDNQVLTAALVSLAKHFDMFTVAEFVETPEDARYLAEIGIDCMQGHYFGAATLNPPWLSKEKREAIG